MQSQPTVVQVKGLHYLVWSFFGGIVLAAGMFALVIFKADDLVLFGKDQYCADYSDRINVLEEEVIELSETLGDTLTELESKAEETILDQLFN